MSLQYLLDGYNIVHQIQGLYLKELEDQRKGLIRYVEINRPQGSAKNTVTIFFDGQAGYLDQSHSATIKVVFSREESADDLIKKTVANSRNKKNMVVVTNDRDIQLNVRAQGARIVSVSEFLKKEKTGKQKSKDSKARKPLKESSKRISKTVEYKITKEMSDIWLKEKKNKEGLG